MFRANKIKTEKTIDGMLDPINIVGNVYFVGTVQASCHIIDTGDGLILIDPGYQKTLFLVVRSIYEAGFKLSDIKYIINTHWHGDHTEACDDLKAMTGAVTMIGEYDLEKFRRYCANGADLLIKDGDTLSLGNTTIKFMHTPGHTKGTVSFFFDTVHSDEKTYRVGMFGGAGANTLVPEKFDYPECRKDYIDSVNKLRKEKVDVFIGNHTWNNNTPIFGEHLKKTGENLFLDPTLWGKFLDYCERRYNETAEQCK